MRVIMIENVKKVGQKDDIIEVSDGYANNFLIKQKKAIEATPQNMKKLQKDLDARAEVRQEEIERAKEIKEQLENQTFTFRLKRGNNGHVFGKISTKEIARKLKEEGYPVERKKIKTEGVNHLGAEKVNIELDKEVTATITIEVVGE